MARKQVAPLNLRGGNGGPRQGVHDSYVQVRPETVRASSGPSGLEQLAGALIHILNSLQLDWNSPYHHFISD